MPCCNANVNGS